MVYKWLNNAMDCGLSESEFWDMTIAEIVRFVEAFKRREKAKAQEEAAHNYILADLIGRSISRLYSSSSKMPTLAEAYPSLFSGEDIAEKEQQRKDELSALRFRNFANAFNNKLKGGGGKK